MKLLKLSFILLLVSVFAACGGDDESGSGDCVQADWVGVYTGTINCDGTGEEDVTVTITASGTDAVIIKYETATLESEFDPYTPDGCEIDDTQSQSGISLTVEATLDGNTLTFKDILGTSLANITCSLTATK